MVAFLVISDENKKLEVKLRFAAGCAKRVMPREVVSFDVMLTQLVLAYLLEIFFHLMQTAMVFSHEAGHDN